MSFASAHAPSNIARSSFSNSNTKCWHLCVCIALPPRLGRLLQLSAAFAKPSLSLVLADFYSSSGSNSFGLVLLQHLHLSTVVVLCEGIPI